METIEFVKMPHQFDENCFFMVNQGITGKENQQRKDGKLWANKINKGKAEEYFLRISNSKTVYFGEKTLKFMGDVFNTSVLKNFTAR